MAISLRDHRAFRQELIKEELSFRALRSVHVDDWEIVSRIMRDKMVSHEEMDRVCKHLNLPLHEFDDELVEEIQHRDLGEG